MPTTKQKVAFKEITQNHRSVSDAMRVAGYDKDTASKPKNLTASKGFQELMDKFFPDELLAKKHRALLDKQEVIVKNNNKTGEIETIPTGEIDAQAVAKGLDMAYKLKGAYNDEQQKPVQNVTYNVFNNPDVKVLVQNFEEGLKKQLMNPNDVQPIQKDSPSAA